MTTPNNSLLWNASLEGFVAGQLVERPIKAVNTGTPPAIGTPDPSYAALAAEGSNWAQQMDSQTPTDDVGSPQPAGSIATSVVATGVAIVPSTDATGLTQFAQVIKSRSMAMAALAFFESRYYAGSEPVSEANFAPLAGELEALYLVLANGASSSATTNHSNLISFGVFAGAVGAIYGKTQTFVANAGFELALSYAGALAAAVDTAILNNVTIGTGAVAINLGNGMPVAPTTGAIQQAELAASRLALSISLAFFESRPTAQLYASVPPSGITAWGVANAPPVIAAFKALQANLITVASTVNNPLLWNEAYCAFVCAALAGRDFTSTSNTDPGYLAIGAAASAFATKVDSTLGASDTSGSPVPAGTVGITASSEGSNTAIAPTTGTVQEAQLGKSGLMWGICRGVQRGRPLLNNSLDTAVSTYASVAASIVALYLEMASVCLNTP